MSRSAKVRAVFGDGPHDFELPIEQLEELQEKTDAGPEHLFNRLAGDRWRVADVRETIRLGLIGGGMPPIKALQLVDRYCRAAWLLDAKPVARMVLGSALVGAPDEDPPPGEPKRETAQRKTRARRSRAANTGSPISTD